MNVELVPLLQIQRDLYSLPRGPERFRTYLKTMVNSDGSDVRLPPLVAMNPMGKDHVPALLDSLLTMEAEAAPRPSVNRRRGKRLSSIVPAMRV